MLPVDRAPLFQHFAQLLVCKNNRGRSSHLLGQLKRERLIARQVWNDAFGPSRLLEEHEALAVSELVRRDSIANERGMLLRTFARLAVWIYIAG